MLTILSLGDLELGWDVDDLYLDTNDEEELLKWNEMDRESLLESRRQKALEA